MDKINFWSDGTLKNRIEIKIDEKRKVFSSNVENTLEVKDFAANGFNNSFKCEVLHENKIYKGNLYMHYKYSGFNTHANYFEKEYGKENKQKGFRIFSWHNYNNEGELIVNSPELEKELKGFYCIS